VTGFDLHTHSTFSDGVTTIEDNVARAAALGLEGLGITDHDTTAPFERARAAGDAAGIEVVLGTEFSAEEGRLSVHVLGYWIDPGYEPLAEELDRLRDERTDRARRIVERFHALDIPISFARVQELAGDAPIGRPHIATAVVELGAAGSTAEVFDRYLGDHGPAYVEKHAVTPERAVELLVAAGGVAVLAHPGLYGDRSGADGLPDAVVERMVPAGLAGIEADHPDHTPEHRARYRDLARGLGLEVTAGSDHHGLGDEDRLGRATTPRVVVERLRAWLAA
jgi:3',5'-nucleoside bisphosphate phosphatase